MAVNKNKILLEDSEKRKRRKIINSKIHETEKQLMQLEPFLQRWSYIIEEHFNYNNKTLAEKELSELEQNKKDITNQLLKINKQIEVESRKADSLQKIIAQIKSYGNAYLQEKPDNGVCPLCGHNHGTANTLRTMIERDMEQDLQKLKDLHDGKQMLENQKDSIQKNIEKVKLQVSLFNSLEQGYKDLKKIESLLNFNVPYKENYDFPPRQFIIWLNQVIELRKELQTQYQNWKSEANHLDQIGFTLENILALEDKMSSDELKDRVNLFSSFERVINSLMDDLSKLKQQNQDMEQNINKQELYINQTKQKSKEIKEQMEYLEKEEVKIDQRINYIMQILNILGQLKEKGIYSQDQMKFDELL